MVEQLISREKLAQRWGCSTRTVDRLRVNGLLPWTDLVGGRGQRPLVRFRMVDIEAYEERFRQASSDLAAGRGAR